MKNYAGLSIKTLLQPPVMRMENARKEKSPYRVSIVCFTPYPVAVPSEDSPKKSREGREAQKSWQDSSKATG
jgi:hypothetical protein